MQHGKPLLAGHNSSNVLMILSSYLLRGDSAECRGLLSHAWNPSRILARTSHTVDGGHLESLLKRASLDSIAAFDSSITPWPKR